MKNRQSVKKLSRGTFLVVLKCGSRVNVVLPLYLTEILDARQQRAEALSAAIELLAA